MIRVKEHLLHCVKPALDNTHNPIKRKNYRKLTTKNNNFLPHRANKGFIGFMVPPFHYD